MGLLTEVYSILPKKKKLKENIAITGIDDIKEVYPDIYETLSIIPNIDKAKDFDISLLKGNGKTKVNISLDFIATTKDGKLDIKFLSDLIDELMQEENIDDAYVDKWNNSLTIEFSKDD